MTAFMCKYCSTQTSFFEVLFYNPRFSYLPSLHLYCICIVLSLPKCIYILGVSLFLECSRYSGLVMGVASDSVVKGIIYE